MIEKGESCGCGAGRPKICDMQSVSVCTKASCENKRSKETHPNGMPEASQPVAGGQALATPPVLCPPHSTPAGVQAARPPEDSLPKEISCNLHRANNPAGIPSGCSNWGKFTGGVAAAPPTGYRLGCLRHPQTARPKSDPPELQPARVSTRSNSDPLELQPPL